jgi:flagellum-specific peptidoglycan hydrolase FlgJ
MLLLVSCSSSQPIVRTSRPAYKKSSATVSKTSKKTVSSKSVASKSVPKKATVTKVATPKPVISKPIASKKEEDTSIMVASTPEIKKIEEKYESAKEENKSSGNETVYSKTEILEATTRVKVTTAMVLDYISQYQDIAKNNMRQYGIPSSIILGQGILESGAGTGPLSVLANNHFGIKCHKDWNGPSVKYDDDEEQECFRKYEQPSESYQDHALFLTNRTWYAPLFQLEKDDYKQWARGLKNAGYATDPKYPDKLIAIIERYQLSRFDSEVLGKEYVSLNTTNQVSVNSDLYQVSQGDTLYSISKKFNITVDDLKRKNDIQDNGISIGQNLKIK